jgi:ribonuclease VapC
MIVVDSSALIAIFFDEPEKQAFETIVAGDERCVMSAVNAHETATVLRVRHGPQAVERLWQLLTASEIENVPFHEVQVRAAAVAFDRYGKGSSISPIAPPTRLPRP